MKRANGGRTLGLAVRGEREVRDLVGIELGEAGDGALLHVGGIEERRVLQRGGQRRLGKVAKLVNVGGQVAHDRRLRHDGRHVALLP